VLNARVQVLLVFPHDDEVHLGVQRVDEGRVTHARPHVGVEAQRLAHRHVQALEPTPLRRGDGGLEEHLGAAQRFPGIGRNARAVAGQVLLLTDLDELRRDARTRGLQHTQRGVHDFGADAVATGHGDGYEFFHDDCLFGVDDGGSVDDHLIDYKSCFLIFHFGFNL